MVALFGQAALDGVVAQTRTTLDIYVVDVEGGNAVLFTAPTGESLLIDSGNVAPDAAIRIMAAGSDATIPTQMVMQNCNGCKESTSSIARRAVLPQWR
jgi:hypothetical protein